jgi:hypothetical protein
VNLAVPGIPILDAEVERLDFMSNGIFVCATFRKARAEMFFNRYYGVEE